jgi:hypothetical protein
MARSLLDDGAPRLGALESAAGGADCALDAVATRVVSHTGARVRLIDGADPRLRP